MSLLLNITKPCILMSDFIEGTYSCYSRLEISTGIFLSCLSPLWTAPIHPLITAAVHDRKNQTQKKHRKFLLPSRKKSKIIENFFYQVAKRKNYFAVKRFIFLCLIKHCCGGKNVHAEVSLRVLPPCPVLEQILRLPLVKSRRPARGQLY